MHFNCQKLLWALVACLIWSCNSSKTDTNAISDSPKTDSITTAPTPKIDSGEVVKEEPALEIDSTLSPEDKARVKTIIDKEYLMGRFNPATHPDFSRVVTKYLVYPKRVVYMRTEAMESFIKMQAAAKKAGIPLKIMSATRPFNIQKSIWERKWLGKSQVNHKLVPQDATAKAKAEQILEWNSMPSTSRHHWGTDIDINSVDPVNWETKTGKRNYQWLVENGGTFGFCQVYSAGRPYGYQEEKWHWSYIPLAKEFTKKYAAEISDKDISGFIGSETAQDIEVVKKYVLGINTACQ